MNTVDDVKVINFAGFSEDGLLVPIEDVPFEIKRIFYVSDFGISLYSTIFFKR